MSPAPIRKLRGFTRYRTVLMQERTREADRLLGVSGRALPRHHAFLVAQILAHLDTIPGVNTRIAEVIVAELGVDMRVFPTAGHLASWADVCSGKNESAGKQRSGRARKGNRWLRGALIEASLGAGPHSTTGALAARSRRVRQRRGHKKAVVTVAHAILTTAYYLLAQHTTYKDPGADFSDRCRGAILPDCVREVKLAGAAWPERPCFARWIGHVFSVRSPMADVSRYNRERPTNDGSPRQSNRLGNVE